MEWVITFITLVTGIVTIIWFIRDVRKENSKILKAILEAEQNQAIALEKISMSGEKTSAMLEKVSEMLFNQTKILEKVADS